MAAPAPFCTEFHKAGSFPSPRRNGLTKDLAILIRVQASPPIFSSHLAGISNPNPRTLVISRDLLSNPVPKDIQAPCHRASKQPSIGCQEQFPQMGQKFLQGLHKMRTKIARALSLLTRRPERPESIASPTQEKMVWLSDARSLDVSSIRK
jgi:hypothetical protein